jgi:segregation and condensation protein B
LLETLALVAYRQPITRGEIEDIRGVSVSSHIIRTLVEREWIRVIGHRDVPGKPALFSTTRNFLDYFGLKKLDELPTLAEIRDLDTINAELDFGDSPDTGTNRSITVHSDADITVENPEQDGLTEKQEPDNNERIDIEHELNALRETYKQIDSMDEQELSEPTTIEKHMEK